MIENEIPPSRRQLVTGDQAQPSTTQHARPCADCPFARKSLPGWLGNLSAEEWMHDTRGETRIECHTIVGPECAGAAIFRANIGKLVRDRYALRLPSDRTVCFSSPGEFLAHHQRRLAKEDL